MTSESNAEPIHPSIDSFICRISYAILEDPVATVDGSVCSREHEIDGNDAGAGSTASSHGDEACQVRFRSCRDKHLAMQHRYSLQLSIGWKIILALMPQLIMGLSCGFGLIRLCSVG